MSKWQEVNARIVCPICGLGMPAEDREWHLASTHRAFAFDARSEPLDRVAIVCCCGLALGLGAKISVRQGLKVLRDHLNKQADWKEHVMAGVAIRAMRGELECSTTQ